MDEDMFRELPSAHGEVGGCLTSLFNLEAEAALLGALLIDNELIEELSDVVQPDDFYEPLHQRMAAAIWREAAEGRKVTPVTLKPFFENDEAIKALGGTIYLARLTASSEGLLAAREIAEQIAQFRRLRAVQFAAQDMAHSFLSGERSFEEATGLIDEAMSKVVDRGSTIETHSAADMVDRVLDRSDRLTKEALQGEAIGVRTSTVSDFNALLAPIEDGTYIVIGGRPSMGKTTLASSVAWGFAANGYPTFYAAAESTEDQLAMRFVADLSLSTHLPLLHESIRHDKLTREERQHFEELAQTAATLPIEYEVVGRCDVRRLRRQVARADARWRARGQRLRVLVVDYMQLLGASENGRPIEDDRRKVNAVSGALLDMAKDFGLTVIALSQLSRNLEQREDKRPRLSDLRESGRIEEDADTVLFVYREEYYLERAKPEPGRKDFEAAMLDWQADLARSRDRVDLILAKNRHGEVKTRTAKFFGKYTAVRGGDFETAAPDDELDFSKLRQ